MFIGVYQETHYKKATYPVIADMRFENELTHGASIKWAYDADMGVGRMGADGGYTLANRTVTDETLTVDQRPYAGFNIPKTEKIQDHRPTQEKWARKAYNVIVQDIDAVILKAANDNAAGSLSAGDFGGTSGAPISLSSSNVRAVCAAAKRVLTNQNVIYNPQKKFANVTKLDGDERYPVAIVPAEFEEQLFLDGSSKNTVMGDEVYKTGYLGLVAGFNIFTSTALPFSFRITFSATPTDGSTITIGSGATTVGSGTAVAYTWETGTITDAPGKVKAETSATVSVGNLVAGINAGNYTDVSGDFEAFVRADMSIAQQRILDNMSAVDGGDGSAVITIGGLGTLAVAQTDANGTIDRQAVIAIFGTSKSVAMIMQRNPEIEETAGPVVTSGELTGYVAKHFVTWCLYGYKVFLSQTKQLVKVPIAASTFTQPNSTLN